MKRSQSTLLQNWGYYGKENNENSTQCPNVKKTSEKHFEAVERNNDKKEGKILQSTTYGSTFTFYKSLFHYFLTIWILEIFPLKFVRSVFRWGTHLYVSLFLSVCPSVSCTPYLKNRTSSNNFWYTCGKW